ncbi:hypothetical protein [Marinospirillum alkaliphilum]|uniref:Porin n=1 Tax=Marinospirillum alkaliphilum DSM 21637 TaxID=1122209 RepID=A0A1K1V870_9GAMM|nr:hypothetical protein [Marinospirillum alkaliphilum]SFX20931.1 hypothetical protein SAMN02745752_00813 [Marinospirillum alkaliphilum DSM 21637]
MKLRTKIAGTVALPLALAIASASQAATIVDNEQHRLNIGGFVAASANWTIYDDAGADHDSDVDYGMSLGTSRLNVTHTAKTDAGNVTIMYENDWAGAATTASGYRLRHAAIMWDGWVAGFTWNGFANLTGLAETIDAAGTAGASGSAPAGRNAVLGRNIAVGDGMSVGVFIEDRGETTYRAVPDLTANFKGAFGDTSVFVGAQMLQVEDEDDTTKTEAQLDLTFGLNQKISDELSLKAALTNYNGDNTAVSVAAQFKVSDQLRTNLVVQQQIMDADDSDATAVWVNAFLKTASGWEWGGEVRMVSADDLAVAVNGLGDSDMRVSLQAKYAF